jgi:hypothetical protein
MDANILTASLKAVVSSASRLGLKAKGAPSPSGSTRQ